ncbi:MAG: hypothetical protein QOH71_1366 [Blastocatellia bacterium]|nr:hypothetical protein [Blastocatellia bacterium]
MKTFGVLFLSLLMLLYGMPVTATAQGSREVFALPDGTTGEAYRVNIEAILRERYQLKLETDARASVFRWALAQGEVPPGLFVRANGTIVGSPRVSRAEPYRFQLKVLDLSQSKADALTIDFTIVVSSSQVRLAHIRVPRLVLIEGSNLESRIQTGRQIADKTAGNAFPRENVVESTVAAAMPSPGKRWTAGSVYDSMLRRNGDTESPMVSVANSPRPLAAVPPTVNCAQECDPTPPPDPNKDFIIDAVTGATRGKTKFDRGERTRIIIKNKNPFLYEYRLSIEEEAVAEPALVGFLDLLPVGKGTFETAKTIDTAAAVSAMMVENQIKAAKQAPACPLLDALLAAENVLAQSETALKAQVDGQTDAFNGTQTQYKQLKAALTNPGAQCPGLCSDADTLSDALRGYLNGSKASFEQFTKDVAKFEERANAFSTNVADLKDNTPACAQKIDDARLAQLAGHYVEVANTLKESLSKLQEGRKGFDTAAKSIEKVFATAGAFYEVRETGDFDLPTNVKIKLERREISQEKAEFAKWVDTKVNFGGGPRFALAGGLVASLLERPEYERVSTVLNGQPVNIVGLKRTSSTRLLPLLMLHARIYDTKSSFIDGIHFSVGLTAKPNSEGTSAEFLLGPSISLIEGRMFFTAGGYLGRKQELQGNLTPGSQIPKDFGDALPISEHYVWKPGFAITYKIK